ncbi:transcriptional regulator prz1 [Fusarium tjaetaba]|uniref:Transcriptional regulator prz1 n=1 Tax=Fusarium tjaetaba TaxID=1567544 RepID=A0A8H5QMX7_9HYPO|nr:transcriptional regulator prz1 [Fusarium tjaetaba]KAF5618135.1 transcriptional regulator prz1 [Fusarium tjaetaba]
MTTATHHQHQPPQPHLGFVVDTYDPDDVVPRGSPLMTPLRPKLEPSPSPPPDIPAAQVSLKSTSIDGRGKSNRHKVRPTSGDAVLVAYLDNGRDPDIAREAARESLPGDDDSPDEEPRRDRAVDGNLMSGPLLQHLAADALQAASIATAPPSLAASVPKTIPDISIPTGQLSIHDEPTINGLSAPRYISGNRVTSPLISSSNGPLPPLHHGVRAPAGESKETLPSQSLPSLRSTFGELRDLHPERPSEQDLGRVPPGLSSTFPTSPAANLGHRFSLNTNLPSSPRSPPDGYRTLSPHSAPSASMHYYPTNGNHPRAPTEYSSSNAGETPNTDHSASTPATSTSINSASITDRMSIDGITHPQPLSGSYTCTVTGCNAAPFQTQYLLNSHMNVHSSIRPHYCPVKGCPRSEGGKGFKRKNEMIRHGLVHDSPGYVCPFCPDREHKYPRPDNLQRHVRVHHIDKDKDDPQLRDVLAQRPDGPNRGRRRRGPPA